MRPAARAIVDFPEAGRARREVFRDPVAILTTTETDQVVAVLERVEALAREGHHLVGFIAYEAAPAFDPAFAIRPGYAGPLVWFAAFREPKIAAQPPIAESGAPGEIWDAGIDPAHHRAAVHQIIHGIEAGDYYQVNFTGRFRSTIDDPRAVYERLRAAQQAQYSALIETGDLSIISISPELFIRRSGGVLESRPMKGTSARGRWPAEDEELARELATSEKERAENVMIVDLIRSDMGRIAVPGTVAVPSMFTVEKYPTVLQMTSHVRSQVPASTTLVECLAALFPCGSVTGAPKIAASKSIAALEAQPRGIYCGALGVVRPNGDFTFNVAIRTISVEADGRATYGAGGGITADSDPDRELAELYAKAAVLTATPESFDLFETMRLDEGVVLRLDRHLARLGASADYFGFDLSGDPITLLRRELEKESRSRGDGSWRVRATLRRDGSTEVVVSPFEPAPEPRRLRLALTPVSSRDRLLYHKTTSRRRYSDRLLEVPGADDAILTNERGEITETTIGNLVLEIDGGLWTPALDCGLLPGILREELLAEGRIQERVLRPSDLERCTRLWMINSLRGWVPAVLATATRAP